MKERDLCRLVDRKAMEAETAKKRADALYLEQQRKEEERIRKIKQEGKNDLDFSIGLNERLLNETRASDVLGLINRQYLNGKGRIVVEDSRQTSRSWSRVDTSMYQRGTQGHRWETIEGSRAIEWEVKSGSQTKTHYLKVSGLREKEGEFEFDWKRAWLTGRDRVMVFSDGVAMERKDTDFTIYDKGKVLSFDERGQGFVPRLFKSLSSATKEEIARQFAIIKINDGKEGFKGTP